MSKSAKYNIIWTIILFVYISLTFYESAQSTLPITYSFQNEDKVFHFIEYFLLGVIFYYNFKGYHSIYFRVFIALLILSYPVLDEWHQSFVPNRDSSVYDALTDYCGMALAFLIFNFFYSKRRKNEKSIHNG